MPIYVKVRRIRRFYLQNYPFEKAFQVRSEPGFPEFRDEVADFLGRGLKLSVMIAAFQLMHWRGTEPLCGNLW